MDLIFYAEFSVIGQTIGKVSGRGSGLGHNYQLHLSYFLVNTLDKLEDEIDKFLFLVFLKMVLCDQETEIKLRISRLASHYLESIRSEGKEPLQHVGQQVLDVVLLDRKGNTARVNRALNPTLLLVISL